MKTEKFNLKEIEQLVNGFLPEYENKAGIMLCTNGTADVLVNGQMYHLKRGMLCIISPLIMIHKISQSKDFQFIHIIDDLEIFYALIHSIVETILQLKFRESPCIQVEEQDIELFVQRKVQIDMKIESLKRDISDKEKFLIKQMIHLLEQEIMLEVFSIYFRRSKVESEKIEQNGLVIYNFIYSLHSNFKKERTVSFYAKEALLSTGHFTSIIKKRTGRTPSEWIIAITILHAKTQLEKTQKSIKEIAGELNFPEQFTFRKYFKQYVGISPKQYRLQVREKENAKESAKDK